jgi:hypothetical protein
VYQAKTAEDALDDKHLMTMEFQTKMGCAFDSSKGTNSEWQGEYTLWWPTKQHYSVPGSLNILDTDEWTGIPESADAAWATAKPKPCPYTFIYSDNKCVNEQDAKQIGMTWNDLLVSPATDKTTVKSIEHVKSIMNEEILDLNETMTARLDALDRISKYYDIHVVTSIVSLVFSILSFGLILGFVLARATCPQKKYASILGVPFIERTSQGELDCND